MAYDKAFVSMVFEDQYGRQSTVRRELVSVDPAQCELDALAIAAAYDAATGGIIRKVTVNGEASFAGPAAAGNIDTGVTMRAQLDGRPEKAATKWPMPLDAYILSGGVVDTANALVVAVQNLFVTPGNIALLSDGEAITGFISGVLDK